MSGPVGSGEAHAGVLPEWFGPHWWTGRDAVLVAAAVILLPLVLRRRVGTYPAARIEHSYPVRDRESLHIEARHVKNAKLITRVDREASHVEDEHVATCRRGPAIAQCTVTVHPRAASLIVYTNDCFPFKCRQWGMYHYHQ